MTEPAPAPTDNPPSLEGRDYLRLVLLGGLIGIPAALAAVIFLALVHELENVLWVDLPQALGLSSPPAWEVLLMPVVGAALVWAARSALPGTGGHEPLEGISVQPTPLSYVPGIALAALGSLAFGAVLGPEAPLIALGSAVGVVAVRLAKVKAPGDRVLATAGSMSAVSALFGGPIVAGAMMLEAGVSMGAALVPALIPGLVAAAIGYTILIGFGSWSGIPTSSLTVPDLPPYTTTRVIDLVAAVVIGLIVALIVPVVRGIALRIRTAQGRFGLGPVILAGGFVVGLLAFLVDLGGGKYQDVLFSGQDSIPALLGASAGSLVVFVVIAKALAYAVSLGSGFRGGPVFPAIFIGTSVAVMVGFLTDMSHTAAVAIGTACGMAAFTRLIVTSLVLSLLLTGTAGAGAIPAAVLAAVTAWLVTMLIEKRRASTVTAPSG